MKTLSFLLLSLSILILTSACSSDISEAAYNENGDPYANGQQANDPYANSQQVNNSYSNQQQMNYQNSSTPSGFVRMSDPKENAFSVLMPKGWQAQVSLERPQQDAVRPCGMATSPDGASRIFFGDPSLPTFINPNSPSAAISQMSKMYHTMAQMSAEAFARDYIQRVYGQQSRPQISSVRGDQEMMQVMRARAAAYGMNPQIDVAVANFSFSYQGQQVQGELYAIVLGMQEFWVADVAGFTSSGRNVSELSGILRTVWKSYETNPQWRQQEQQKAQQTMARSQAEHQQRMQMNQQNFNAHQQRMQANQQAFDAHNQNWNQQQQINDQSHQNFTNYLKDENTITNGGYESQVQTGYNYYWVDQTTGQYIGTNIDQNPDPSRYQLWQQKK